MNISIINFIKSYYIRNTKLYKNKINELREDFYDENRYLELIEYSKKNVPYYIKEFEKYIDINNISILRKTDIVGKEDEFISKKYNPKLLIRKSTGGTSGISLNIYRSRKDVIIETAFTDYAFSLIAPLKELRIGILRGHKPSEGIAEKQFNQFLLSSYDINAGTICKYVEYINENRINCLSVYPTAITIFCKYLLENPQIQRPNLKGILSSSEILSRESKELIQEVFPNIRLIDLYGQNEHVAFALSIDGGYYKFYNQYGYTEFVDTNEYLENGNKIAEIISTGFVNEAMPLIRYGTEDYVELDSNGNVISIIGRTQDFLVNAEKELVPCIVSTREKTLENVINFQYYQDTIGQVTFRVVVNNKFSKTDNINIIQDIEDTFSGKIIANIEIVDSIEKTKNGKQKRLVQKLNYKD